jgi:maltose O-acetyltransferase
MQNAKLIRWLTRHPGLKWFVMVSYEAIMHVLFSLPRYRTLNALKAGFLRLNGARIGARPVFYPGVWLTPGRGLTVGDDVDFALDVLIESSGSVSIGDRVLIGYRTQIFSMNHIVPPADADIFSAGREARPTVIEDDVWLGANCIVLPGVRIGAGAVIGAGSVVTRDIPPRVIAAGNPARVIRPRN